MKQPILVRVTIEIDEGLVEDDELCDEMEAGMNRQWEADGDSAGMPGVGL